MPAPKIIGSKVITDTEIHLYDRCKLDKCSMRVEAMLGGIVDLIEIRILAVVGNERCESHRGRKGKGFFSMLIREELVIPNRNPNWVMRKGSRLIFLHYLSRYGNTRFVLDGFGYL